MQNDLPMKAKGRRWTSRRLPPGQKRTAKTSRHVKMALRKKEQMAVSEWVEKYRVVPADSPVPGYWRNLTTPYLAGIMDAIMADHIQEVVVCAPPQTGKTDLSLNSVGYTADRKPGNWLIVYPDEKTAGDMSRDRVQPMFNDSPRLRRYLTGAVDDVSTYRLTLKHARLYLAWASSATRLAARPLPYVLLDEIDKYPPTAGKKEAGPIDLARKRTRTFGHMRKIIRVSTPTVEKGPVWQALETECEAVFVYWVRCPYCDAWQKMEFTSIRWDGGGDADPRTILSDQRSTWYECPKCGEHWDDAQRDEAVAAGEWRDRDEGIRLERYLSIRQPVIVGFHYPAWISRFVPMREVASAFLRSRTDFTKLKDFRNDYCAEPWKHYHQDRPVDSVLELVEDRPREVVPSGGVVVGLTAGIDTQDSGFWYWIHAHGKTQPGQRPSGWCVSAGFVTDFPSLADILWEHQYCDVDGNRFFVEAALQDAGGHRMSEVYDFCRAHPRRILPSIGRQKLSAPVKSSRQDFYPGSHRPIAGGINLVNIWTTYFKDLVSSALEVNLGDPGSIGLYADFPKDYAAQIVAEFVDEAGVWQCPSGKDNHLLDCLVLNFALAEMFRMGTRTKAPIQAVRPEKTPAQPKRRQPPQPPRRQPLW